MSNSANSLRFFMWIFLCHLFYKASHQLEERQHQVLNSSRANCP